MDALLETLKRAATALKAADVGFALAGGSAAYARGAAPPVHDVDFVVREEDAEPALRALESAGMRRTEPPEDWLVKAYDGERLVDLIFRPAHVQVDARLLDRATPVEVGSIVMPVLAATDLVVLWLLALSEHSCDFSAILPMVRALREQVDWPRVADETAGSPYAYAFLVLLERLAVIEPPNPAGKK